MSVSNAYVVTGMTCQHCVHAVTEEVSAVGGVIGVDVDLESGRLTVVSDTEVPFAAVAAAVDEAGYAVAPGLTDPAPMAMPTMKAPVKLAAFGAILAAVFGIAFLTGTQSAALLAPPVIHGNELGGLTASVDGYTLRAVERQVDPGEDVFVEFSITGPDGRTAPELADLDGTHLHVFAIRRDLTGFQHVTPDRGPGTSWWPCST